MKYLFSYGEKNCRPRHLLTSNIYFVSYNLVYILKFPTDKPSCREKFLPCGVFNVPNDSLVILYFFFSRL